MYEADTSDEELAAFEFKREDYKGDVIEVWPENHDAFMVFEAMSTQWRIGMSGPTGLDHNVLFHRLDRLDLSPDDYAQMDFDVRVMERQALETMAEERDRQEEIRQRHARTSGG